MRRNSTISSIKKTASKMRSTKKGQPMGEALGG